VVVNGPHGDMKWTAPAASDCKRRNAVEIVESWLLERYHSPIILCLKGGEDDVTAAEQKTLKSKNR
jgi:hypothetical protein